MAEDQRQTEEASTRRWCSGRSQLHCILPFACLKNKKGVEYRGNKTFLIKYSNVAIQTNFLNTRASLNSGFVTTVTLGKLLFL